MIDISNVAYAVLNFNGSVGMRRSRLPIPWSRFNYDRKHAANNHDLPESELSAMPHGRDIDRGDRDREIERHDDDRLKTDYWGIAESWRKPRPGSGGSLDLKCRSIEVSSMPFVSLE